MRHVGSAMLFITAVALMIAEANKWFIVPEYIIATCFVLGLML